MQGHTDTDSKLHPKTIIIILKKIEGDIWDDKQHQVVKRKQHCFWEEQFLGGKYCHQKLRNDTVVGEGGFGKVYKGWLQYPKPAGLINSNSNSTTGTAGSLVAVKKLNSQSMQGFQEWQSEVNFLGKLSHPNLVKLLGYWGTPLPWDIRIKILIGAASGLAFLHASDRKVIYRDFKASNILLDGLSDFGLAKMGPTASKSHVSTQVMGTYGYAAPEYVATGHLRMLKAVMDSRLQGRYPSRSALQIAQLALNCLQHEPRNRPSMQEIVDTLEKLINDRPTLHSTHHTPNGHHHHRSPLHVTQDVVNRAYPLPPPT
ncbi:hypothetical protein DH2020_023686 [Rehmannia glutinosa]|uniref:Protein kinase domain-containing protein n=1 Tax=Rehmannia glutinosa TaxID=99300 RepID=A0ABR0W6R1_REHGL